MPATLDPMTTRVAQGPMVDRDPLLTPVTMSLFGMMNWMYMWFRDGGRVSREDYADVVTTLILEGIRAVR